MRVPTMTREVAIDFADESQRVIYFYSTPDALEGIKQFGDSTAGSNCNKYRLIVDARYNFKEVVKYIEGLANLT